MHHSGEVKFAVFIQSEAQSNQRLRVNERTLELIRTVTLPAAAPYPYGFILHTCSEDGDALDCFIITQKPLRAGTLVTCNPIGLLEMWEGQEWDPKILAVPQGETTDLPPALHATLSVFLFNLFSHFPNSPLRMGRILPASAAVEQIQASAAL